MDKMMWFNNAKIYQFELDQPCDLTTSLSQEAIKPCPPHARFIYGWIPAYADELVHEVAGSSLICLGKEERLLPRGVIQRELIERVQNLEAQRGYAVKRAEKAQLAEDIEFELLPKAFCLQKKMFALLDFRSKRIIINTASETQASQLISLLRKSVANIRIEPIPFVENLSLRFSEWMNNPTSLPPNMQLAANCLLFALDDEKKQFNCKGYELPATEISTLLSQGLAPAEVSLIWNDHIQFTLTQDFTFKRIKCLDYLVDEFNDLRQLDEEYQQHDAALTLLSSELRALFDELLADMKQKTKELPGARIPA
jgi:recombination associated protein RdgC